MFALAFVATSIATPLTPEAQRILAQIGYDSSYSNVVHGRNGEIMSFDYPAFVGAQNPRAVFFTTGYSTSLPRLAQTVSGYPIGASNYAWISYGRSRFASRVPGYCSTVSLRWQGKQRQVDGNTEYYDDPGEQFYLRLEAALRWMVANAELRGASNRTGRVRGHDYTVRRNAAGKQHISARLLAQKEGLTLYENKDDARFMLRTQKGDMIFPLGSNQVKVGDTWVKLNTILSAVDDEPYIPLELIERYSL